MTSFLRGSGGGKTANAVENPPTTCETDTPGESTVQKRRAYPSADPVGRTGARAIY
jgi:hypothetical protein